MTERQAKLEAIRRWGKNGTVMCRSGTLRPFRVGVMDYTAGLGMFLTRGSGDGWDLAFVDADRREQAYKAGTDQNPRG